MEQINQKQNQIEWKRVLGEKFKTIVSGNIRYISMIDYSKLKDINDLENFIEKNNNLLGVIPQGNFLENLKLWWRLVGRKGLSNRREYSFNQNLDYSKFDSISDVEKNYIDRLKNNYDFMYGDEIKSVSKKENLYYDDARKEVVKSKIKSFSVKAFILNMIILILFIAYLKFVKGF